MNVYSFIGYGSAAYMECGSHAAAAQAWLPHSIAAPMASGAIFPIIWPISIRLRQRANEPLAAWLQPADGGVYHYINDDQLYVGAVHAAIETAPPSHPLQPEQSSGWRMSETAGSALQRLGHRSESHTGSARHTAAYG